MTEAIGEFYVAVNQAAEFEVNTDAAAALSTLVKDHGGMCVRVIKVTIKLALPEIEEAAVTVVDAAGKTEKAEVRAD
jgi:hypothetical protein